DIRFVAGGTTLIDLMKLDVEQPQQIIDINKLPLAEIERTSDGGLKIGALVRNADLANHRDVVQHYPVLSEALLSGATGQLRNMATTGGNLLQRTRCVYFRDSASACNKRQPGSGCSAIGGFNRNLAVLGTSEHCIASNPSDMNVALAALEATVVIQGVKGKRHVPIDAFFLLPGDTPDRETVMLPGDLITHVLIPPSTDARSHYLKLRDRASYEFALASAAVVVTMHGRTMTQARVALGGVGTRPWRSREAEEILRGKTAGRDLFAKAADAALHGAHPQSQNGFKVDLAKRCLIQALATATA
ncbi:MAG TPA: xanthine dehydrogenase family protein subunit M, partial [Dyella sp.]|uniref:FAD binding domain-containing protein n=1 Tax=Dyella sp. TaxID=1869338 RepID=UPI002F91D60B